MVMPSASERVRQLPIIIRLFHKGVDKSKLQPVVPYYAMSR